MIITEKQILCLLDVLKDSIKRSISITGHFSISHEQRTELYSVILNQQSDKLIEVKDGNQ